MQRKWLLCFVLLALLTLLVVYAGVPRTAVTVATDKSTAVVENPSDEVVIPVRWESYGDWAAGGRGGGRLDAVDSTMFIDSLEGTFPDWTSADLAYGDFWHLDDLYPLGGSGLAWWCGDPRLAITGDSGGYNNHWLQYLILDTLNLSSAVAPVTLAFKARWGLETPGGEPAGYDMWDSWNVWASTNNGASWTVLQPTAPDDNASPAITYTGASSYAFGEEWGMGPGIPAYGGQHFLNNYVECIFPLTSLIGQSSVLLRIAMCSDPVFCTIDDRALYGLLVDSIRVTDASRTDLLSNDGEQDDFVTDVPPPAANNWFYVTGNDTSYSPTSHWVGREWLSVQRGIYSYPITGPAGYQVFSVRYYVWCDLPDSDGDNQGSLEDYYAIHYSTNDGATWTQIVYDYAYANSDPSPPGGNSLDGWVKRTGGLLSGGVFTSRINVPVAAGVPFRVAFECKTDNNDDGGIGTGLHIDDVEIVATRAFPNDMSVIDLLPSFPTTVGLLQKYNYTLKNDGLNPSPTTLRSRSKFIKPDGSTQGTDTLLVMGSSQQLPGEDTVVTRWWTPAVSGPYRVRAYYSPSTADDDRTNDTTQTPTNVPANLDSNLAVQVQPAGVYELGYNRRVFSSAYLNPRFIHFTPLADGVPAGVVGNFDLTDLRVMWRFDPEIADSGVGTLIQFWREGADTFHTGALIASVTTIIDTTETIGAAARPHWWRLKLCGIDALHGLSGSFWVSFTPQDTLVGDPSPLPLGISPQGVARDGHTYYLQDDTLRQSGGRLLIQATIEAAQATAPAAVANLVVRRDAITNNVTLTWSATARARAYFVWRGTTSTSPQSVLLTPEPIGVTTYTDRSGFPAGGRYFYVVVACN